MDNSFKVMAFYEFAKIDNTSFIANSISLYCKQENIRGTVIIAPEGINGTLAGFISSIDKEYLFNFCPLLLDDLFTISN